MTTKLGQTIVSPWLTPVRVVSTVNLAGTYFNGNNNDGAGATLTIASGSLSIDSVTLNVADRLLLAAQTNTNENGIYIVNSIDPVGSICLIQRAGDQQSLEQYKTGQYVSISAGTANEAKTYVTTEPLPARLGIDALNWTAPAAGGTSVAHGLVLSFSGGATRVFTVVGMKSSSTIVANPSINSNGEPVLTVTPGTDSFTMVFAGDPGVVEVLFMAIF